MYRLALVISSLLTACTVAPVKPAPDCLAMAASVFRLQIAVDELPLSEGGMLVKSLLNDELADSAATYNAACKGVMP